MPYDAIESLVEGIGSLQVSSNSGVNVGCISSSAPGMSRPPHPHPQPHSHPHPPSTKQQRYGGSSSRSHATPADPIVKTTGSTIVSKRSNKNQTSHLVTHKNGGDEGKEQHEGTINGDCAVEEDSNNVKKPVDDDALLLHSKSGTIFCPSPQGSFYSAMQYTEAKESFTNTEASECVSNVQSCDYNIESRKTSDVSDISDESSSSSTLSSALYKPHKANDARWEAIRAVRSRNNGALDLKNFRIFKRLGCGDIGSVHLAELIGTRTYFAMKVMDKEALVSRKKIARAQTEREILQCLDHPFLPTLYTHFETEKLSFLVMEFCPGGDLHALRQKQPGKYFPEHAARFYLAEVLLALEYLHMLGIIYRDLKPENVLVREDGHIMLSDFDLSLRCAVSPTLVKSSNSNSEPKGSCIEPACVIQPACIQPTCFGPRFRSKPKKDKKSKSKTEVHNQVSPLPELIAEPTNARSMSFVGTHEYLAPEIIKGEGHGSAVDWWTFGIFLYELLFGRTPFKGNGNRATLFNVVGQPLRFPETPTVSFAARDLIRGLLVKEPQHRLAYRRGATEIKQHPFFQSVNWALIRCASPPDVPTPFVMEDVVGPPAAPAAAAAAADVGKAAQGVDVKPSGNYYEIDFF